MSDVEIFDRTTILNPETGLRKEIATHPSYSVTAGDHCNNVYSLFPSVFAAQTTDHDPFHHLRSS